MKYIILQKPIRRDTHKTIYSKGIMQNIKYG